MNNIFIAFPGESEAQAHERLRLERRDFLTPEEREEERQAATLREIRIQKPNRR